MEKQKLSSKDYQEAFKDLGIRMVSVSEVIKQILGKSLPAVATSSGRVAAQHLPYYFEKADLKEILEEVKALMSSAWGFEYKIVSDKEVEVTFKACAVREICVQENKEIGGDLCNLFHGYFSGLIAELSRKRLPVTMKEVGNTCIMKMDVR